MFYSIANTPALLICVTYVICALTADADGIKWPTASQELLDERNDAKIFQAVKQSMQEWEKTHKHHRKKRADKNVCYGSLGCFSDTGPFSYLEMLPASPEEINTKFFFYSTKNRSDRPLLELPYLNMSSEWDEIASGAERKKREPKSLPVDVIEGLETLSIKIIVHGFGSSCPHVWIYEMRTALMAVDDCIVICVDWENGAVVPNYVKAAANTRLVGKQLAMLLRGLEAYRGVKMSRVHIIGFSLGAHVSGFAGAEIAGLSRITGLDPAGPLFESQHPKARLDSSDATFVDVIHSNGENLILGGLGSWQPMGHVDFYPNGGRVQHGCSNLFVGAVTDFIWSPAAVEGRSLCNHRRAYKFFIDSVASRCLFPAFPCDSYEDFLQGNCFPCTKANENSHSSGKCGNMGYYADRSTGRGQLFLLTREEEPFCAHQFILEVHSAEHDLPLRTMGKFEATLEGDGGLNETFTITAKDDSEFFAGDVLSRILVPHPALGFPSSITLSYKSYSGWLSKGLPHWTIQKVMLTDSFGKSYSLCKKYFTLESGRPIYLQLQPGNCTKPEENQTSYTFTNTTEEASTEAAVDRSDENLHRTTTPLEDDVDRLRNKKDTINRAIVAEKHKPDKTSFLFLGEHNSDKIFTWQPVLEGGNSLLDKDSTESSRGFQSTVDNPIRNEVFEPVLKQRGSTIGRHGVETGRSFVEDEIQEPVLKSTTQKSRRVKNIPVETPRSFNRMFQTVQLFPARLGEFLERAERYARETILPFITEQVPRLFGGVERGRSVSDTVVEPVKYFPPLGEIAARNQPAQPTVASAVKKLDLPPILPNGTLIDNEAVQLEVDNLIFNNTNDVDQVVAETNSEAVQEARSKRKNILSLLRTDQRAQERSIVAAPSYYVANSNNGVEDDRYVDMTPIKIDLPTYRPEVTFPYKFVSPDAPTTEFSTVSTTDSPDSTILLENVSTTMLSASMEERD